VSFRRKSLRSSILRSARKNFAGTGELAEMTMRTKLVAPAALVASFAASAFAADEFFVVQDAKTKKCTVVDKKPTEASMTVVSPTGAVYKTRAEAEVGMKTVKICSSR
jgi:hypothetical protein